MFMEIFKTNYQVKLVFGHHLDSIEDIFNQVNSGREELSSASLNRIALVLKNIQSKSSAYNHHDKNFLTKLNHFRDKVENYKSKRDLLESFSQLRSAI